MRPLVVVLIDRKFASLFGILAVRLALRMVAWLLGLAFRYRPAQYQSDCLLVRPLVIGHGHRVGPLNLLSYWLRVMVAVRMAYRFLSPEAPF